ncbi:PIG-L deacetylase family protein [Actinomycetospora termitidis]|uniref:PIG-L family deacetylase n=1 Tax=Actinomycetospora termitidis TaxID=3053470 RepID=A0ABT7MB87_9PSEU|nr:PIG-L family deacetylase [Actinomycetospora sp. Odt1-22]MDL5157454.1 PIG-L family deacetylase [Actinomycetospora sp. Odt1-22]
MSEVADSDGRSDPASRPDVLGRDMRRPWSALEALRPLTLRSCRRIVVVAPHPRDEIRAAGGLLRRLGSRHAEVDVLSLTERPTWSCPPVTDAAPDGRLTDATDLTDVPAFTLDDLVAGALDDDVSDDEVDAEPEADPDEVAAEAAYRALGLSVVRRHRLGLPDGGVAQAESDVVAAISEIVGFSDDPGGLCVLAPWSGDGDDDHEAAGRAAEVVTAAYRVRLVRWLDRAWTWAGPDSAEVPWRRARQVLLTDTVIARKHAASAAFLSAAGGAGRTAHDAELPDGWAPGPREVFLV